MSALRRSTLLALVAVAIALLLHGAAHACPMCSESLAQNDPHSAGLVRGYFWSIVFMMSMPFVIFFTLGGYFWYQIRRARRLQAAAQLAAPRAESFDGHDSGARYDDLHEDSSAADRREREPVGV
jgi:hypothetical protein